MTPFTAPRTTVTGVTAVISWVLRRLPTTVPPLRSRLVRAVTAITLGFSLTLVATPGNAAPLAGKSWVASPNGVVGVEQQVILKAPALAGQVATFTFTAPGGASNAGQAAVNSAGFAYLPWTPNQSGTWTLTATGGGSTIDASTIAVSAVPTVTSLQVQNDVVAGENTGIVARVQSLAGSIAPSGTVNVRNSTGGSIASDSLRPAGVTGESIANLTWQPGTGTTQMTATFTPVNGNFGASTSSAQSPIASPAQVVAIRMPANFYLSVPETLSAVVNPSFINSLGGSVAFNLSIDGFVSYPMGGSRPLVDGTGTAPWTPTKLGYQSVNVQYASLDFQYNGNDSQIINVLPAPSADTVTLTGGGAAWAPRTPTSLVAGTDVTLAAVSRSGNPVTLAIAGPCAIEGATLTALGVGACTVTTTSMGNAGNLRAASTEYSVNVTPALVKKRR